MLAVKLVLSTLLLVLALLALLTGEWNWGRPLAAVFFLALSLLTWTMHYSLRVRSVLYGMFMLAGSCCFLYGAVLTWNGAISLPEDCSQTRRVLGCHLWNALYLAGGAPLMGGLYALLGTTGLVVGARLVVGSSFLERLWSRNRTGDQ